MAAVLFLASSRRDPGRVDPVPPISQLSQPLLGIAGPAQLLPPHEFPGIWLPCPTEASEIELPCVTFACSPSGPGAWASVGMNSKIQ